MLWRSSGSPCLSLCDTVYGGRGSRIQSAAAAAAPAAVAPPASRNAAAIRTAYVTGAYITVVRYSRYQNEHQKPLHARTL